MRGQGRRRWRAARRDQFTGSAFATGSSTAAPPAAWRRRIPRVRLDYQPYSRLVRLDLGHDSGPRGSLLAARARRWDCVANDGQRGASFGDGARRPLRARPQRRARRHRDDIGKGRLARRALEPGQRLDLRLVMAAAEAAVHLEGKVVDDLGVEGIAVERSAEGEQPLYLHRTTTCASARGSGRGVGTSAHAAWEDQPICISDSRTARAAASPRRRAGALTARRARHTVSRSCEA